MKRKDYKQYVYLLIETICNTKSIKETHNTLLKEGVVSNTSFGSFKQHTRLLLIKFCSLDIYIPEDWNKIINRKVSIDNSKFNMSSKTKKDSKTNKTEWEKNADEILKDVDPETMKELLKDFIWKEIERSESEGKHKSNNNKTKIVDDLIKKGFSKVKAAALISLPRRTYYSRKEVGEIRKTREDAIVYDKNLQNEITAIFKKSNNIYGPEKIAIELERKLGKIVSISTVNRIKKKLKLKSNFTKNKKHYKESKETRLDIPNLLTKERLSFAKPSEIVCADFSVLKIQGEHYHLYIMIDPVTNKIIYWEFSSEQTSEIVLRGILENKNIKMFHSDHGTQFSQYGVMRLLNELSIEQSMGRVGISLDNRPAEFFFGLIKNEFLKPNKYSKLTPEMVRKLVESYVYWYNNERIFIEFRMSPNEYEQFLLK